MRDEFRSFLGSFDPEKGIREDEQPIEEVVPRATHDPSCWKVLSLNELGVGGKLASCTCGLDEALRELEKGAEDGRATGKVEP